MDSRSGDKQDGEQTGAAWMDAAPVNPLALLLPYQRSWVEDDARFKAGLWARQTGKDFSSAAEEVRDAMSTPRRDWTIAAPSERQSLEHLEKCKDWVRAFNLAIEDYSEEREGGAGSLLRSGEVRLSNGSRIRAVPGRPDTVRGLSTNVTLTEFAFFDDPMATWRAIYPSITNPLRGGSKKIRVISTANGKTGRGRRFYEIFRDNLLEPQAGRKIKWSCHKVTIHDAVTAGLPIDIDELREGMDDAEGWIQEFECEFLDGSSVLLPYELIALAESIDATLVCDPALFLGRFFELYCGIDFGRTNDPTVCWTLERVGDLLVTREILVLRGMPSDEQEDILSHRIAASRRTCFDYTGPGIGLGDYLVAKHGRWDPAAHEFGLIELCTFTAGFKREIFPRLRRAFEAPTKIRVPVDVDTREDLHAMQQVIRNGQFDYAAPHTAAGHSDRCTAAALALRASDFGSVLVMPSSIPRRGAAAERRRRELVG